MFRQYDPTVDQFESGGYPLAWKVIKHIVRDEAGNRCVRCGHPYVVGQQGNGEWTPCDMKCAHLGPVRIRSAEALEWREFNMDEFGMPAETEVPSPHGVVRWEVEAHWRILTVHHLDGDKANCRWFNLAPLCQRCHLTIQGRVQMARVWPWEHSDWFKPYVAGYYALVYLEENLTREETMARLDELLALERATLPAHSP